MKVKRKLKSFTCGKGFIESIWWKNVTAVVAFGRVLMEFKRWVLVVGLLLLTAVEIVEEKCWRRRKQEEGEVLVRIVCSCESRSELNL